MFHKMPFILIVMILFVFFCGNLIPETIQSGLLAASLTVKSLVVALLPFVIFALLFQAVNRLAGQASRLILGVLAGVCCSNFISTWLSYGVGHVIYSLSKAIALPDAHGGLQAFWIWEFPRLIGNDKAMFAGIVGGIVLSRMRPVFAQKISRRLEQFVRALLAGFVVLVPLFVVGFVVKMQADGLLITIAKDYALILAAVGLAQVLHVFLLYSVANGFVFANVVRSVRNMLPAGIAGFSTMSSAAAMPITIFGVERNSLNKDLARSVVPLTVNIHLVGDCIAIPVFAFAILKSFGVASPEWYVYLLFSLRFVAAKFSVAAVPGGGILVMLPILESCFGFSPEMLSLITAIYILFDPVITCANVLGNGAFAMLVDRFPNPLKRSPAASLQGHSASS